MRIPAINTIRNTLGALAVGGTILFSPMAAKAQTQKDTFEYTQTIPPQGTTDSLALKAAPNPQVKVKGEVKNAVFVVDLSKNVLYHYDENGKALEAFSIASGKPSTPTHEGVRIVSHVESYPYRNAPKTTKRYKNPRDYGPRAIILDKINPITGETSYYGEFIHGNKDASSIGKYASQGCMRMDNEVIKRLAKQVKRGLLVVIKK